MTAVLSGVVYTASLLGQRGNKAGVTQLRPSTRPAGWVTPSSASSRRGGSWTRPSSDLRSPLVRTARSDVLQPVWHFISDVSEKHRQGLRGPSQKHTGCRLFARAPLSFPDTSPPTCHQSEPGTCDRGVITITMIALDGRLSARRTVTDSGGAICDPQTPATLHERPAQQSASKSPRQRSRMYLYRSAQPLSSRYV